MKLQFEKESYQAPKHGLILLQVLIAFLFCLLTSRFWYLQIHKGEEYLAMSMQNRLREEKLFASRGIITDKNGILLAENSPAFGLTLVREDCRDIPATLAKISSWTGVSLESLEKRYEQGKAKTRIFDPILLLSDIPFEQVSLIEAGLIDYPGIQIVSRSKRHYLQGEYFTHILGYVAEANEEELEKNPKLSLGDTVGKSGIELTMEDSLRGEKGLQVVDVDVLGRALGQNLLYSPKSGQNLQLSIDSKLQEAVTNILGDHAACVVVMEPRSGKLRALVTRPSYDNNLFVTGFSQEVWNEIVSNPKHPLQNRVIQSTYPPGSVWKLMMAGLFLQEKVNPKDKVLCTGETKLGNQVFRCWKKGGHGNIDMANSLIESCDVYYYYFAEKIGIDKIEKFALECGFGKATGIDLPHEKNGLVPSRAWKESRFGERWQRGETLNISIGQGFTLVTPLQMASFMSAIINDGKLIKPLLLESDEVEVRGEIPINAEGRALILETMLRTVDTPRGTAKVLARKDAVIGGKTGTAQVVKLKFVGENRVKTAEMEYKERDHAWIVSYGIKDGQEIVVVVMVEHGGGGASVAGPITKQIYEAYYSEQKTESTNIAQVQAQSQAGESIVSKPKVVRN